VNHIITATWSQLIDDASYATEQVFGAAVKMVDRVFEEGYAAEHPELVAALVQASSWHHCAAMFKVSLQDVVEGGDDLLRPLTSAVNDLVAAVDEAQNGTDRP
jgi:hypothetical protein